MNDARQSLASTQRVYSHPRPGLINSGTQQTLDLAFLESMSEPTITIEQVLDKRGWSEFLALPGRLYADDPHWVAPLLVMERHRFSPKNPYFQNARFRAWIAKKGDRTVGRITAQVDEMHLRQHGDQAGYFGMLESEPDSAIVNVLLETASQWLREEGMRQIRGPFNLHINEEVGLLVEGFDTPPYVMMGHARPWYQDAIVGAGFEPVQTMLAYQVAPDFEAPQVMLKLAERASQQVTVRPLERRHLQRDADIMRDVFNDAWHNNWGFVPMAEQEWGETVDMLSKLLPDDYIQIAEYDGEPVAFIVALPNLNEATADLNGKLLPFGWAKLLWRLKVRHPKSARVPLMGVREKYQHSRLGPTLAFLVIDAVRKALSARGVEHVEMGWILEGNQGMRNIIETIGGVAYKRYRVYNKELY